MRMTEINPNSITFQSPVLLRPYNIPFLHIVLPGTMWCLLKIYQRIFQTMFQPILKVHTLWLSWTLGPAPCNQSSSFSNCIFWLSVLDSDPKLKSISTFANVIHLELWVIPFSHSLAPFRVFIVCYFWTSCCLWQCVRRRASANFLPDGWTRVNGHWSTDYAECFSA